MPVEGGDDADASADAGTGAADATVATPCPLAPTLAPGALALPALATPTVETGVPATAATATTAADAATAPAVAQAAVAIAAALVDDAGATPVADPGTGAAAPAPGDGSAAPVQPVAAGLPAQEPVATATPASTALPAVAAVPAPTATPAAAAEAASETVAATSATAAATPRREAGAARAGARAASEPAATREGTAPQAPAATDPSTPTAAPVQGAQPTPREHHHRDGDGQAKDGSASVRLAGAQGARTGGEEIPVVHIPAGERERIERVADALEARLKLASSGDGARMRLQLSPRELGDVLIRLELKDGVATAHLVADTRDAARALTASMSDLKTALADRGVRLDIADVRVSGEGGAPAGQQQQAQGDPTGRERRGGRMAGPLDAMTAAATAAEPAQAGTDGNARGLSVLA